MTGHDPYRGQSPVGAGTAGRRRAARARLQAAGAPAVPGVPTGARDAVAWLQELEAGSPEGVDRAHLALAAEQERPEAERRATVLAAIGAQLDAAASAGT